MLQLAKCGVPCAPQWGILMGRLVYTGFWVHWIEKIGRNWEKSQKIDFSGIFHGWIWPFPDLKPVPIGQKWYSLCPQWGILMGKFVPKGFWVHWTQKIGRIWEKSQKIDFSDLISGYHGHFKVKKIWSKCSILVLFGPLVGHWDMQSCFSMFVHVFQATRGVKNDLDQNLSFFADIYKVNGALNGGAGCHP